MLKSDQSKSRLVLGSLLLVLGDDDLLAEFLVRLVRRLDLLA
jgi:hypothetical protein